MKIITVEIVCNHVKRGYRIVRLADGRFAFIWGNMPWCVGDTLPQEAFDSPTDEEGAEAYRTYDEAEDAYRRCAEALRSFNDRSGNEMLAKLPE